MGAIAIISIIMSIILFVRIFLLDKEFGHIQFSKKHIDNIANFSPKDGYNISSVSGEFVIIQSGIYSVEFKGLDNKEVIYLGNSSKHKICEDGKFEIKSLMLSEVKEIIVIYDDKFNNRYLQKIILTPKFYDSKNKKLIPSKITISKRRIDIKRFFTKLFNDRFTIIRN